MVFFFLILFLFFLTGGRYIVTSGTGDLYIRNVRSEDSMKRFSCLTVNSLTGEKKLSDPIYLKGNGRFIFHLNFLLVYYIFFFFLGLILLLLQIYENIPPISLCIVLLTYFANNMLP